MNVIFEYGNTETDKCDIKQRAQDWVDLTLEDLGSANYLAKLQTLTDAVTAAGAAPTKPNGSAINQVRTNEKLFGKLTPPGSTCTTCWEHINWELRQYQIDSNGLLTNTPTDNVPLISNNYDINLKDDGTFLGGTEILDWIYGVGTLPNKVKVQHGNHHLPSNLIQPTAELDDEWTSYFGLDFTQAPVDIHDESNYNNEASKREKDIRKQISLQSCGGCHTSETKTLFTMIRPLGYGQSADYWGDGSAGVSTSIGEVDQRFYFKNDAAPAPSGTAEYTNLGLTWDNDLGISIDNQKKEYYVGENRTVPNVSAFLTGRNYRAGTDQWEDDRTFSGNPDNNLSIAATNILGDNKLTGLFYVNDPDNTSEIFDPIGSFPQYNDARNGFNDLERRKLDLCRLIGSSCTSNTIDIRDVVMGTSFVPIPE